MPVMSSTVGVMRAATPHPYLLKMVLERSIMRKVTAPVHDEKSPMKEEYSLGLGNWALILLFHVTSTKLILIPYATTCTHSRASLSSNNTFVHRDNLLACPRDRRCIRYSQLFCH